MKDFKMSPRPLWKSLSDVPMGSSCSSFHICDTNAAWRVFRPVMDYSLCIGCHQCYLLCPDGAIHKEDAKVFRIDYDFCKGCGICAHQCKPGAISMVKEDQV